MTDSPKIEILPNADDPVDQFGGMTPRQFGAFADQVEEIVRIATDGNGNAMATLWVHLLGRIAMDAGEREPEVVAAILAAIPEEVRLQRARIAQQAEETKH